jgi:hypothetical protein
MNETIIHLPPGIIGARQDVAGAAKILGMREHDIPVLTAARLLKPLGNPTLSAPKYYATCELVRLANDVTWLDRATRAITQHWARKNARRPGRRRAELNQSPQHFAATVPQPPNT